MTQPQVMTVNDIDPNMCGALVYWSMSGTTNIDDLGAAWDDAGLDQKLIPLMPSPETALRRAVKEQASKRILVRRITNGWALVNEKAEGDSLDYAVMLRVKLDKVGRLAFEEGPAWEHDDRVKIDINSAYLRSMDELSQTDMSGFLVKLVDSVAALRLRETGGFYFIPKTALHAWRSYAGAIRASSDHTISEIPALTSTEAIDAVLSALRTEAEGAAVAMEEELAAEELGAVALRNRSVACEKMADKVSKYEKLLGVAQTELRDRLDTLKVNLATAALMAGGSDD